ncbi:RNA cap guanine-N2 methyltransferase [Thioflavicoccus mobilis 8321]|uniref:RNA cap guanine-N2 methyltransferase n=1 Tax=Thioflavicoccus mobilis 8321 TaxID=765912 RepID=L0H3Q2_9GAMM|nr:methyltransferase domain-containing protein [Thioflavicoccus mobilis]AGA92305.1 RNA cap guanine-N2 methyltransferase [Thioflavicoccus mobilis 8321]
MRTDPNSDDISDKFGDGYTADARTYRMGIDRRFSQRIAGRFRRRRVLETCTGGGFTTIALAREAAHVVTIEIAPAHQDQARRNIDKAGLSDRVTLVRGDALSDATLAACAPFDSAFLDPDWAVMGPDHVYRFRDSNTQPPADALLEKILALTPNLALVLPPAIDLEELTGLPAHERQSLYFGETRELYCLYFGELARSPGETVLRG